MKHIFNLSKSASLACALGAVFATSVSAQTTNNADVGKLTINAQVIKSTCAVLIGDRGDSPNQTSYKAVNLGSLPGANSTSTAGAVFGQAKQVVFSLKDPNNTTADCDLAGVKNWYVTVNLVNDPAAAGNQVVTINGKHYLKNAVADGTDAVVALFNASTQLTLTNGVQKLRSSGSGTKAMSMFAQFAHQTSAAAKPGIYNFSLPVTITYD